MKKSFYTLALAGLVLVSCSSDDDAPGTPNVEAPATYVFQRNGETTVSFSGQTTRIKMSEEILNAFKVETNTEAIIDGMYNHQEGGNDFSEADLNASEKNPRSKTAASNDYFSTNTAEATEIKEVFDGYIADQVNDVFPRWGELASAGVAGQIADGSSTRYINDKGLELNQAFAKSLIGGLMTDQALNNYLGTGVLDKGTNRANNDSETVADGKNYTTMEHKWDEAYGYLYGTSTDVTNPNPTIGSGDSFLNKYIGRVEGDSDFAGIAADIWNAFKLGRAAIVAKNYQVRDEQAAIIKQKVSEVIAIRAVYYLQQGKANLNPTDMGPAFHDLSEGYGFIYSLRFTQNATTGVSYFTKTEVDGFISSLMGDGTNGLWDVTPATLDSISEAIAAKFGFTVAQAAQS